MSKPKTMNIDEVKRYLPQRYPFLMIDRVLDYTPDERLLAMKNITVNEPCFNGHFPDYPVFPGVMQLEAMAQACAILAGMSEVVQQDRGKDAVCLLAGTDNVRFKHLVRPGDQVLFEVVQTNYRNRVWKYAAQARVDDRTVSVADITFTYRLTETLG